MLITNKHVIHMHLDTELMLSICVLEISILFTPVLWFKTYTAHECTYYICIICNLHALQH